MQWWLVYLALGAVVGFLAGLLGIGGGAVVVPMLVFVFTAQGLPAEHTLHIALGTAMATIMFTSLSSMRAHHGHGAVDWSIARAMAPGILAGSFCAALLAAVALWMLREADAPEAAPAERVEPPTRRLVDEPPQPFRLGDGPAPVTVDEPAFAPQPFRRGEADEPLSNPPDSSPR